MPTAKGQQAATRLELHFAPAAVNLDGHHIEAYSLIPWPTDPQTSFRALTKPADPEPSAHLAASAGLAVLGQKAAEATVENILYIVHSTGYSERATSE